MSEKGNWLLLVGLFLVVCSLCMLCMYVGLAEAERVAENPELRHSWHSPLKRLLAPVGAAPLAYMFFWILWQDS